MVESKSHAFPRHGACLPHNSFAVILSAAKDPCRANLPLQPLGLSCKKAQSFYNG